MQDNGNYTPAVAILGPDGKPMREGLSATGPERGMAIPHVIQFAGMAGGAWRTFMHSRFDEAMRHSREDALAMRNDCYLQALMQERALATASLKWHIEIDSERDVQQMAVKKGLEAMVRATPRLQTLLYYVTDETVWAGRGGAQFVREWRSLDLPMVPRKSFGSGMAGSSSGPPMSGGSQVAPGAGAPPPGAGPPAPGGPPIGDAGADPGRSQSEKRRALCVRLHQPVSGDSLGHRWDGTPYCLVHSTGATDLPGSEIISASVGRAVVLKGTWRPRFLLHSHIPMAANFFDVDKAEAVHGVGVRSVIFWWNNLRLEFISNVADWCERTGLGVRVWYYQAGNVQSEQAVAKAAAQQRDKVNLLVPRYGDKGQEGVEFVDTATAGADLLLKLQQHIEEHIERYVIGQSMTSGGGQGDSLGGEGKSKLAADTKGKIIAFDANNLADSITQDWIQDVKAWTYPDFADMPARFVLETDEQDPQKFMQSVKLFVDMGGEVRESEVRGKISISEVMPGDKTLKSQQGAGGMPGAPPGAPPGSPGAAPGGEAPPGGEPPPEPDEAAQGALSKLTSGPAKPGDPDKEAQAALDKLNGKAA